MPRALYLIFHAARHAKRRWWAAKERGAPAAGAYLDDVVAPLWRYMFSRTYAGLAVKGATSRPTLKKDVSYVQSETAISISASHRPATTRADLIACFRNPQATTEVGQRLPARASLPANTPRYHARTASVGAVAVRAWERGVLAGWEARAGRR